MGLQETAEDVLGLVQALAQGKQLEQRRKFKDAHWGPLQNEEYELYFNLSDFEYRIKTDPLEAWRKELLEHVLEYAAYCGKAEAYYARNNIRAGDTVPANAANVANAANALNKFKTTLASGPKDFK